MSQHTRKLLSARPGLVNEMPDVYTAGPQMFNELFNFPPGLELLGVPPSKADGVPGSKLNSYNNWRVLNGQQEQQYDYAGSFNSQKEANMNPQSLDAMQLYVLNSANRGNFSAPTITNGGIDHHQSSSHGNSIQFQLPAFPQSIANQGLCNIEQVPSRDSWQSGGGVNELLLLPTGNGDNLLNNNIQFIPPHQLNHTDWENGSLQASTSQWCEQSSLETKFGTRDDRSVQGLSLSLASNPQVQETHARLISTQDMANRLQATAHPKDNSVDVLNGYKVGVLFPFSRSEGILSAKGYWNPNTALSGQFTGYVKQSKYMKPTRQLLDEFCNVAGKEVKENFQNSVCAPQQSHQKSQPESTFGDCNINQFINQSGLKIETSVSVGGKATAVMCNERLNGNGYKDGVDYSKERFELRRRKAKLVWMLDEVERRYRQYCEQMKIVGTSFDSAAGVGAATTYTCLAAKAMSRHFKCLKDAITGQIKETNDALGEKESNVPGITKGETPRLKLIEQSLRQRRTFQCKPCRECYSQSDPIFNPALSSTFNGVPCDSNTCRQLDVSGCSREGRCLYEVNYGDGSYTIGTLDTETLTLGRTRVGNVAIGCGHDNEGLFVGAAGLLGLGGGAFSLPSQLSHSDGNVFSYCLVNRDSGASSTLRFGREAVPREAVFAPMLRNHRIDTFYYVSLAGISVGGNMLPIAESAFRIDASGNGGVILDSGTPVTRLQHNAYVALRDAFVAGTRNLALSNGYSLFDTCYYLPDKVSVAVPSIAFHFSNGVSLPLPAKNFLVPVDRRRICLAFAPVSSGLSIIGSIQQQGIRVSFDPVNGLLGFAVNQC